MSELSFLGINDNDSKNSNPIMDDNNPNDNDLIKFDTSLMDSSILHDQQTATNLLDDFSFKLVNTSSNDLSINNDNNEKNPIVNELIDNLVEHVQQQQNDGSTTVDNDNDDDEDEDKENNNKSMKSPNSSFRKNLSFEMNEACIREKQQNRPSSEDREILTEIKIDEMSTEQQSEMSSIDTVSMISMFKSFNLDLNKPEIDTQSMMAMYDKRKSIPNEKIFDESLMKDESFHGFSDDDDQNESIDMKSQKFYSIEVSDMKTTFTTSFPFTLSVPTNVLNEINIQDPCSACDDDQLKNESSNNDNNVESKVETNDKVNDKTVEIINNRQDLTLNESTYDYIKSIMQTPPSNNIASQTNVEDDSDAGTDSYVDAEEELCEQTLVNHNLNVDTRNDGEKDDYEIVSTPTPKSPKPSTVIADYSFTCDDHLELLKMKISYENQIIELSEKQNESEQVLKLKSEQIDRIQKEYDLQCEKYRNEIDELNGDKQLLQKQLEEQKIKYETIVNDFEATTEHLRMDNANLKNQYETTAMKQINELKQMNEQLSAQYYEAQNENQKLNNALLEMDEQRCSLRENIETLKSNIIELNQRLAESKHERYSLQTELEQQLSMVKEENESLKNDLKISVDKEQNFAVKINNLKSELSKMMANNQKLTNDKIEYEEKYSKIENRLFDCEEQNLLLETRMEQLEEQLTLKDQEFREKESDLLKKIENLEKTICDKQNEIESIKLNSNLTIEGMQAKIEKIESKNSELNQVITELESKCTDYQKIHDENQRLSNELTNLKKEKQELFEKCEQSENEWANLRKKFLEKQIHLEELNENLTKKINELTKSLQEMKDKNNLLESESKSNYDQLKMKFDQTSQRLVESDRIKFELESKNASLLAKNTSISVELGKMEKRLTEEKLISEQVISSMQKRLQTIEMDRDSFKKECSRLEDTLQKMQTNLETIRNQLNDRNDEFDRKQNEIKQQCEHIKQQQLQINNLNAECKLLNEKLQQSSANIELEQLLKDERRKYYELMKEYKLINHKFQVSKRLIPTLTNEIDVNKEMGEKLKNEIAKLMMKVDANKKDSVRNEKVKEILNFIDGRISFMIKEKAEYIGADDDDNVNKKDSKNDQQQQQPQQVLSQATQKSTRAFKPIESTGESMDTAKRCTTVPKSLNVTNKENIL